MKHKILSLIMAALVAAAPLFGQSPTNKEEAAAAEPATGVRFVNCSPAGIVIPSPLYCRSGKTSRAIRISSRIPSSRVKPTGTTIELYDQDPGASTEKKTGSAKQEAIQPVMTLEVPEDMRTGKVLCVLVPMDRENPFKVKPMFVRESSFPKSGVHFINFTATPLQVKHSAKGDYSDAVVTKIGPYKGSITRDNTWSVAGDDGQFISFILSAQVKGGKDMRRIKASRFAISSRQSQINLIVKDPDKDSYKLLSIQLTDKDSAN